MRAQDSGIRVQLAGGPFDESRMALLADWPLDAPPRFLAAYLCPCCAQVVVMTFGDGRNLLMGAKAAVYVWAPQDTHADGRLAYEWEDDASGEKLEEAKAEAVEHFRRLMGARDAAVGG